MARTILARQAPTEVGLELAYSAATADGFMFDNDGHEVLHVVNDGGVSTNVTIETPRTTIGGLAVDNLVVAIPAGEDRYIGRLDPSLYNRGENQTDPRKVYVNFSVQASVTAALMSP